MKSEYYYTGKKHLFVCIGVLLMCITSCEKLVQAPPAKNTIVTAAVFADSADATSGVLGMYIKIMAVSGISFLNGFNTLYCGMSADEMYPTTQDPNDNQFYTNSISSTTNSIIESFWENGYNLIYQANACIEGLQASSSISVSVKNQLVGESKLMRALCYFHLVNLFGPIPLVTTTNYEVNADLPRSLIDSVYAQVIDDLIAAQNLLPVTYPTTGRVRPNQYAATALLAKVYLYLNQWSNAEAQATQLINSTHYSLEPNLNNVFSAGSNEAIWQFQPIVPGYETSEGELFIPGINTVIPSYVISNFLLNAFEPGDQRRYNWLDSNIVNGQNYFYPFKYQLGNNGYTPINSYTPPQENYMIFRLGEQYLIRAEARAEQGNIAGADSDLNIIRRRAGLLNYPATGQTDLLTAIAHERQVELFCEWGNRWYDLKRTGQVNTIMGSPGGVCAAKGGSWNTDWQIYPIPHTEITSNPFLTQNPGYN
jgi:starch-binding outer membrane protein, SusD/RagB family